MRLGLIRQSLDTKCGVWEEKVILYRLKIWVQESVW